MTADAQELLKIVNEYFNPYEREIQMKDLDIMSVNADGSLSSTTGHLADSRAAIPPVKNRPKKEETPAEGQEETPGEETGDETAEPDNPAEPETPAEPVTPAEPETPAEPANIEEQTPQDAAA